MSLIETRVALLHQPYSADDWLRFGRPSTERRIDRRQSIAVFSAGAVFAYVRWRAGDYGTVLWRLWVLQATCGSEPAVTLSGVDPGASILLAVSGEGKVKRAFALIDEIEALALDPAEIAPTYWQVAHNRLAAHGAPRAYGLAEHQAFLAARSLQP